jgi:uncharacterized membrane protein
VLVATAAGVAAAATAAGLLPWDLVPMIGWDVTASLLMVWTWTTTARLDAARTAEYASAEDPAAGSTDVLLLGAAVASLAGVGLVLLRGGQVEVRAALAVLSLVLSWGLVHTIFTLEYARLYYTGGAGGVGFAGDEPPDYLDFAYLAFTIGMTFQVSDTDLETSAFRRTALRHALLSYLFGAVILAAAINLVAGLNP